MLHKTKPLFGKRLSALDGAVGHVKDFYFDDQNWAVRYLVVDTGSWLTGRRVLLSPHALGLVTEEVIKVNLTRRQIEESPSIEAHKPLSRRYEEDYYRYYGWPAYWEGGQVWGAGAFPMAVPPGAWMPPASPTEAARGEEVPEEDWHLQSLRSVIGYSVEATDGQLGDVADVLADYQTWQIAQLLVETGNWFSHRTVVVPTSRVGRISYTESKVDVSLTQKTIRTAQDYLEPAEHVHRD